jgi:hypothetical protein
MPYVACPQCSALTYAPRSYLTDQQRCPACEAELDAGTLLPLAIGRRSTGPAGRAGGRRRGEAIGEADRAGRARRASDGVPR